MHDMGGDRDNAAFGHGIAGIVEQIDKALIEMRFVNPDKGTG